MKNIEKIRTMSAKELAFLLSYFSTCEHCAYDEDDCTRKVHSHEINCQEGIKKWLESEERTSK